MTDDLVVMLTAFNDEYNAVHRWLTDVTSHRHDRGTRFEIGTIRSTTCRVALSLTGKGTQPAAVLAERAIAEFSPAALMFVGVAGALWDTPLGDVVVATHICAYHGATSEDDGLKARPRVWETDHEVSQVAQHVARTGTWTRDVPSGTAVHFGVIAAGEVVHNSRLSAEARWIRQHYNDALAIEMEAAGVAQAGHLNGSPVAVVRGISDWADGTKTTDADRDWQPQAAANAAAFAVHLATELVAERTPATMTDDTTPTHGTVYSTSHGQVGIQAVNVTGSTVWQHTTPPTPSATDFAAELAALRAELARERSRGQLDDGTFHAAQAELDIADKALTSEDPERGKIVVLALKKLGGLVAELADLAAKITALIAAAKGLA
ncbi:5'-methylthioadenosine/S-adenosylhomocysteine nucleosidase family protein [Amycolatopsis sp. H20-H5]|uniref:5'-methylthioadenosine/S-adenosylhomocysteine nucleosidase family protein n=1 Tax=Amycolatopsis sp. H20-H5 TaxID=3046309 RepID=UPI002DBF8D98|nr:5'-methylthioadenosine/S-adenosylhomocysteine nucleosidase [Amycolatopsis sp. H20-H5]MEC3978053.1 5'-methylthioadenosine/S-adenosylhomocysteine nucleosidase [Amycolatopsis sp. H20-H5]